MTLAESASVRCVDVIGVASSYSWKGFENLLTYFETLDPDNQGGDTLTQGGDDIVLAKKAGSPRSTGRYRGDRRDMCHSIHLSVYRYR